MMTRCAKCRTVILFGGVREGKRRFCGEKCHANRFADVTSALPDEVVFEQLLNLHAGPCPHCGGEGPIDVYTGHRVWSLLIVSDTSSVPKVCCRRCGFLHQSSCMAFCMTFGWWGFPYGLVMTPIQIMRNIASMIRRPRPDLPSAELEEVVRVQIGEAMAQGQGAPPGGG